MCRWSSQITSDYADCPLNPSRLVSTPPPLLSSPFSHSLSLITVLVAHPMVCRGVSTQLSLIKIIGILILQLTLFILLFSSLLLSRTFFAIPLAEKNAPSFFCQSSIQNPLSRFFLCYNFSLLFNEYANYLYQINWNHPINPVRLYPWFYWGER